MTEREIKRIRNKFITVATLTLFGVMLLMGGFIYLFGVITVRNETYQIMEYIAENGYDPQFGARPLKRYLQKNVEFMAANENISGAVIVNLPTETFRMAVVVLIVLPILICYPFFRKAFLRGLTVGAVKE